MLVIGGAVFGFIPGLPEVSLEPDVVLALFLPPLLYKSAIYANFGDFRANLRGLTLSTIVLVIVTTSAVAVAAHLLIPGMPWAAAFVLGAIVSPTDPVAAATVTRRLDAPRRLVSAVEGGGTLQRRVRVGRLPGRGGGDGRRRVLARRGGAAVCARRVGRGGYWPRRRVDRPCCRTRSGPRTPSSTC